MIKLDTIEYVGPCSCGRRGMVILKKGTAVRANIKLLCDGRLYRTTPMMLDGEVYPRGAQPTTWCRTKHYRWEELLDKDE